MTAEKNAAKKSRRTRPTRRRWLAPEDALLVGRVQTSRVRPGGPPMMTIEVWCPFCKQTHSHGWAEPPFPADHVEHRAAHCHRGASPLCRSGYYIGLDPGAKGETALAVEEFAAMLAWWKGRLAERVKGRRPLDALAQHLALLDPAIGVLLRDARRVRDDGAGASFCPNVIFDTRFRPRLRGLVGYERPDKDPVLSSSAAYDVVYDAVYNPLPPCRNCFCLPVKATS